MELRDSIAAVVDEMFEEGPPKSYELREALLEVLDDHTTEQWTIERLNRHGEGVAWDRPTHLEMKARAAYSLDLRTRANPDSLRLVSRRVTAWEPVEGET